ncbi:hypothetical protein ACIBFB_27130 [Nocardiopsis sp. NPDC050513]|uniref:hypothetical protein n=1 Tax=Nocardiopsis sp. NPDC050513 TaxID=3364338 RepID=UPI00379511E0
MRPYLIEGLDCSGKKTVARRAQELLAEQGVAVDLVIGPLVQGPLGRLDGYLANITRPVSPTGALGRFRRLSYTVGPVVDGVFYRPGRHTRDVKVSSHYRAWARARAEGDGLMDRAFASTHRHHPVYAGATLLSTAFDVRLRRHREDVATGRTSKNEQRRFFGPDQVRFEAWHTALDGLMERHIPHLQRLDSGGDDIDSTARRVVQHALNCWEQHR